MIKGISRGRWGGLRRGWESRLPLVDSILVTGLAVLLCTSGIYAIPHVSIPADGIVYAKRIYYLMLMGFLAIPVVVGRFGSIDRRFSLYCGFLALVIMGNALIRQDKPEEYIYSALSITFIWLFVRHVVDGRFPLACFLGQLRVGVLVVNLLALYVLLRCLLGDREIQALIASGFDGNRVNFSIWLWQIVFLNFFFAGRQRRDFFLALALSSVVLTLQVFSGGRIGVLAALAVMAYFTLRRLDGTGVRFVVVGWLLLLVWVAGQFSPVTKVGEDISIFRQLAPVQSAPIELQSVDDVVEYADGVSAHRVRILINAVGALDTRALFVGKGIGHFDVVADSGTWMVHNVYLKTLGELGIGAFLPLLSLAWLPFSGKYRRRYDGHGLHFMLLVGIGVGLLQPRFVITGLSNCLVMWLCYALILKGERAESPPEAQAGRDFSRKMV